MHHTVPSAAKRFLRVGEAAEAIFGVNDVATRARVTRLCDAGELACVRLGARGDRLIPSSEAVRLLRLADSNLRGGGDDRAA